MGVLQSTWQLKKPTTTLSSCSLSSKPGNTDTVQILAELKADLSTATPWGDTPLSVATSKGHSAIVEILKATGAADLNQADRCAAALQQCGHTPVGIVVPFSDWCTHGAPDALTTTGKVCYEVKLLTSAGPAQLPQFGWASPAFICRGGQTGAGDDAASWAVDGVRGQLWHGGKSRWESSPSWVAGDTISIAVGVDKGDIWCAHNGEWVVVFQNDDLAEGVFPVVTSMEALVSINLGEQPLQHPPPSEEFITVCAQTGSSTLVLTTDE